MFPFLTTLERETTQKLIREKIRKGDRVWGYQAGPTYAILCELEVASDNYRLENGTWAIDLKPIRWLDEPISLATLKAHPLLSQIKFVQQTQISISGITAEQTQILDNLIVDPVSRRSELSEVDQLCNDLEEAQFDTSNAERFEQLLRDALEFLGLEAEHVGGAGDTDILVNGQLGADSYSVVVDAKTRSPGVALQSVNFDAINQHREQNTADYALIVAPSFSSGNIQQFAEKHRVALLTTETLIGVLKLHSLFPFGTDDLRMLFDRRVPAQNLPDRLQYIHQEHEDRLRLTSTILDFFDKNQRQNDKIETIDTNSVYWYLKASARETKTFEPDLEQIEEVLHFLSSPILDILDRNGSTYILTVSPNAARQRLDALFRMLGSDD